MGQSPHASFGQLLKRYRITAGLSQEALAERAALSGRAVMYLERGVHMPYPATLLRLARALRLTPEEHAALREAAYVPRAAPVELDLPLRNPYKGLRAFTGADAGDFFGREGLIDSLLTAIGAAPPAGPRFLAVIGPSGSGKSSVVRAGLVPQLQLGALPGSEEWIYLDPLLPGAYPLEALTVTLGNRLSGSSLQAIRDDLDSSPRGLHLLALRLRHGPTNRVVLIVDQCEELFTLTVHESERRAFIDRLTTAASEPGGALHVIVTLRADFCDRPLSYPALGRLMDAGSRFVLPMELAELRAAIEQPAALPDVQLHFEDGLVATLLAELRGQAGALPLLQFTLDQLFERREGRDLTLAAYEELGGIQGALARHAERTFAALPSDVHRALARALFLRLIDPGATEQDTARRRAPTSELALPDPVASAAMRVVADAFVGARLLIVGDVAGAPTIEVSHEALIREWRRLIDWLREARDDVRLQGAISADTAEWECRGRPGDRLYRGAPLEEALAWAERSGPSMAEHLFLQAAVAERDQQKAAEQRRQRRELETQRHATNRLRALVSVLIVFLLVAAVLSAVALRSAQSANQAATSALQARKEALLQRNAALDEHAVLLSRQLAAEALNHLGDQYDLALLLSVAANRVSPTWEARNSLLRSLEYNPRLLAILHGHTGAVLSVAFSSDGMTLASGGTDQMVRLWNLAGYRPHGQPLGGHTDVVSSVAFSPGGTLVASSSRDGTIRLWDPWRGTALAVLSGGEVPTVTNAVFSPDGTLLAAAGNDGGIRLWDVATRRPTGTILTDNSTIVASLAFSPDGRTLAAGATDGSIRLWDVRAGRALGPPLRGHSDRVTALAFSPDGSILASGSFDRTVRLWEVASGRERGLPLRGHSGAVTGVAFSPAGRLLASTGADGTIRLWDVASGRPASPSFPSLAGAVDSVAFSPDGLTLASGNDDGSIWLWAVTQNPSLGTPLYGHRDAVNAVAFGPTGGLLVSASADRTLRLWDVAHGRLLRQVADAHADGVTSVAISPDGKLIASGGNDSTVRFWDAATGRALGPPLGSHNGPVTSLAFSPDGRTLVSASGANDSTIRIWDVRHRRLRGAPLSSQTGGIFSVAFRPDGKVLATGNGDGSIQLWDVSGERLLAAPFKGQGEGINSVAFSPKGTILASGGADRAVRLWSVATGRQLFPPLRGHTDTVTSVAFDRDGAVLASASSDGTIRLWDVATGLPLGRPLTGHQGSITSLSFSADGHTLASGSVDTTVRIWHVDVPSWIRRACRVANRALTALEWKQYLGDEPPRPICG